MSRNDLDRVITIVETPETEPVTLEERVADLEDRRQITELLFLYGLLCDSGRWDDLLEYYTDDIERVLSGTLTERVTGKPALRELYWNPALPRVNGAAGPTPEQVHSVEPLHLIHAPVIRFSDDRDTAILVAVHKLAASRGSGDNFEHGEHEGIYIFEARKLPGIGWRFSAMEVISGNGNNPLFKAA